MTKPAPLFDVAQQASDYEVVGQRPRPWLSDAGARDLYHL